MTRELPRASQTHRAYSHIKSELLHGRFNPSETLIIDDLASELGVSRQPVLDAMRRLAHEHLVDIIPQVGCRVADPSPQEISDFFLIFSTVEGLLAQLAAERGETKDIHQLKLISLQIGAVGGQSSDPDFMSEGYRIFNRQFHSIIHGMAKAPEIVSLSKSYWDRSDFYMTSSTELRIFAERLGEAHEEHEALIEAISSRDSLLSFSLMRSHILNGRQDLLSKLKPHHEYGNSPKGALTGMTAAEKPRKTRRRV